MIDNLIKYKDVDGLYDEIITRNAYGILPGELKDTVIVDIGANIGIFSMNAIRWGAKASLAFEPGEYAFKTLSDNCEGLPIIPFNAAISDHNGECILHIGEPYITCFTIMDNIRSVETDVTCSVKSIDYRSLIPILKGLNSRLILKSDCEGAEHLFMYNPEFTKLFDIIYIEVHELHDYSIIKCIRIMEEYFNVIETTGGVTNITYKFTRK